MNEDLIRRAQQKDPDAFTSLIQVYMQLLYKTARQILNNDEDIADAMQEAILVCWEKLDKLRNPSAFKGWLIKILVNKCYDQIRKKGLVDFSEELLEIKTYSNYDRMEWQELLWKLDEKYRVVLILYYLEEFKTSEISEILEIPETTVRTRLKRGREKLADIYQGG